MASRAGGAGQREDEDQVVSLVRAAVEGDRKAWDQLVERYSGLVWSVARGFGLSQADAADVSQTTWLRLVEHLESVRNPERVGAWLAATARHECLRILRRQGRQLPTGDEATFEATQPPMPGADAGMLTAERDAKLWKAFETLAPRCQQLLRLLTADPSPSYAEVGTAMDMPIGSIGPTRARCLDCLRRKSAQLVGS